MIFIIGAFDSLNHVSRGIVVAFHTTGIELISFERRISKIMANVMPAIFFGHGNPMNAVTHSSYTEGWRTIGEQTSKPKAILSISLTGLSRKPP